MINTDLIRFIFGRVISSLRDSLMMITMGLYLAGHVSSAHSKDTHEDSKHAGYSEGFSLAIAGDWGDHWGPEFSKIKKSTTRDSLSEAAKADLIVLLGDLSYGKDDIKNGPEQASRWCDVAKTIANNTPMIFVPGDHDSNHQDGDIATYVQCLTPPNGISGKPQVAQYGQYPYLYYVDVIKDSVKLRVVATSIAFQEEESEPKNAQKYFHNYEKGSRNYRWLKDVYHQAQKKDYWIIHINHLPCIDMGKNQSFGKGCEDVVNLNVQSGVNIMLTGSSHNIWRTRLLRYAPKCSHLPLTHKATGANPACAEQSEGNVFLHGSGLIQAHAGAAGKTSASKRAIPCDIKNDGEAAHYLAPGTCGINDVPGFVQLDIGAKELKAEYYLSQKRQHMELYGFKFFKK